MQAVIMAGGKGTRLKPYTITIPKPLVPVQETPVLEIIIRQLKHNGFKKIILAVGHMGEMIQAYFGNGSKFGIDIGYSYETEPLGTIAPLKLIDGLEENFIVMNSDDLTDLNYIDLLNSHIKMNSMVTIGQYKKEQQISLGVLETDINMNLLNYVEKPVYNFNVSMGIYAFHKKAVNYIPENEYFDFPSLIKNLLKNNEKVVCYSHSGFWLDIGRPEDYVEANEKFSHYKKFLFGE
jgi:NDP-sugar pyrophosphorylase family protein